MIINGRRLIFFAALTLFVTVIIIITARYFLSARPVFGAGQAGRRVVIVDPGHGGIDGGAESAGGLMEKHINLSISKKLADLLLLFGVDARLTRDDDYSLNYSPANTIRKNKVADLNERLKIAENEENPVYLSIHLNKFEQTQYYGAQTFYSKNNPLGIMLADCVQKNLREFLNPLNKREIKQASDSIFLMNQLKCPAVIVECGFLSNPDEELLLQDDNYQKKIAIAVCAAYLTFEDLSSLG